MARMIPKGYQFWTQKTDSLAINEIVKMYESGFAGAWSDPEAKESLWAKVKAEGGFASGADAAYFGNFAGSAAGQLVPTWMNVFKVFPGCWPGAAQERGDCVSHSQRNANLTTLACEIVAGKPDEVTGKVEGAPELPAKGISEGVLSSAYTYWWRGYGGDGWSCDAAADVTLKHGVLLMKPYADLGIDLTEYSGSIAGKYGSQRPPTKIEEEGKLHVIRTCTELGSFEEVRDFLANGFGISTCGGEGWSSSRDENGFSRRQGGWSHALAFIGADDRDVIKQKYGEPLVLIQNSWGPWNSGPTRVLGTNLDIPQGSFWAKWSDAKSRYIVAMAGVSGWARKSLPNWNLNAWG